MLQVTDKPDDIKLYLVQIATGGNQTNNFVGDWL
jgi:hypothetical protein